MNSFTLHNLCNYPSAEQKHVLSITQAVSVLTNPCKCEHMVDQNTMRSEKVKTGGDSKSWMSKLFERLFVSQGRVNTGLRRGFSFRSRQSRTRDTEKKLSNRGSETSDNQHEMIGSEIKPR